MSTSDDSEEDCRSVERNTHQYERAPDERPSEAVIAAVADATGKPVDPYRAADSEDAADALSPLYETVDPEALDALITSGDDRETDCEVTFTYDEYAVTVRSRSVTVTPAT